MTAATTALPAGISVTRFQCLSEFWPRPGLQGRLGRMMARWLFVPPPRHALDQLKQVVEAD